MNMNKLGGFIRVKNVEQKLNVIRHHLGIEFFVVHLVRQDFTIVEEL